MDLGIKGSAYLKVNDVEGKLSLQGKWEINGIEIRLGEVFYTAEKEDRQVNLIIKQLADCLINEDCKDGNPCTNDVCSNGKCYHEMLSGCVLEDKCLSTGEVVLIKNLTYFCKDNRLETQKPIKIKCSNNYECESNYCDKVCKSKKEIKSLGGEEMAPMWILIVFSSLFLIDGILYIIFPNIKRKFLYKFIKGNNIFFRIIGSIAIVIGLLLMIWALT